MPEQSNNATALFSDAKVAHILGVADSFSDTEAMTFAWGALRLLDEHALHFRDVNPQMTNCLILARVGLLTVAQRYVPQDVLAEALRRDDEGAPLFDRGEQWQHFLAEHPELKDF